MSAASRAVVPTWLGPAAIVGLIFVGAGALLRHQMNAPDALLGTGRAEYERLCSNCHGDDARGHGPLAASLPTAPPDLTMIAARSGGTLDAGEIAAFIDGRCAIAAHGPREMPAWGNLFEAAAREDPEREAAVRKRIDTIVAYLWSIQR